MPSLKDLKNRINSIKSTRKITSAMKMVAASKLRRAQDQAEASRPYTQRMQDMLRAVSAQVESADNLPRLLTGTGHDRVHLVVVCSSDRGLCGAFNTYIVREARRLKAKAGEEGKELKFVVIGKKAREILRREFNSDILAHFSDIGRPRPRFEDAERIANQILTLFESGAFDKCSVLYNKFQSALVQHVTLQQLIPLAVDPSPANDNTPDDVPVDITSPIQSSYEFEPAEGEILESLLPRNLKVQIFSALLESAASEHGARMTAMDNATRNARDLIKGLTLKYNRERQAYITREIIEIISGAEAL